MALNVIFPIMTENICTSGVLFFDYIVTKKKRKRGKKKNNGVGSGAGAGRGTEEKTMSTVLELATRGQNCIMHRMERPRNNTSQFHVKEQKWSR